MENLVDLWIDSIAVGGADSFAVEPKTGLAAGTYTATVTVYNSNVPAQSFNVSFTVNPAPKDTVADPSGDIVFEPFAWHVKYPRY